MGRFDDLFDDTIGGGSSGRFDDLFDGDSAEPGKPDWYRTGVSQSEDTSTRDAAKGYAAALVPQAATVASLANPAAAPFALAGRRLARRLLGPAPLDTAVGPVGDEGPQRNVAKLARGVQFVSDLAAGINEYRMGGPLAVGAGAIDDAAYEEMVRREKAKQLGYVPPENAGHARDYLTGVGLKPRDPRLSETLGETPDDGTRRLARGVSPILQATGAGIGGKVAGKVFGSAGGRLAANLATDLTDAAVNTGVSMYGQGAPLTPEGVGGNLTAPAAMAFISNALGYRAPLDVRPRAGAADAVDDFTTPELGGVAPNGFNPGATTGPPPLPSASPVDSLRGMTPEQIRALPPERLAEIDGQIQAQRKEAAAARKAEKQNEARIKRISDAVAEQDARLREEESRVGLDEADYGPPSTWDIAREKLSGVTRRELEARNRPAEPVEDEPPPDWDYGKNWPEPKPEPGPDVRVSPEYAGRVKQSAQSAADSVDLARGRKMKADAEDERFRAELEMGALEPYDNVIPSDADVARSEAGRRVPKPNEPPTNMGKLPSQYDLRLSPENEDIGSTGRLMTEDTKVVQSAKRPDQWEFSDKDTQPPEPDPPPPSPAPLPEPPPPAPVPKVAKVTPAPKKPLVQLVAEARAMGIERKGKSYAELESEVAAARAETAVPVAAPDAGQAKATRRVALQKAMAAGERISPKALAEFEGEAWTKPKTSSPETPDNSPNNPEIPESSPAPAPDQFVDANKKVEGDHSPDAGKMVEPGVEPEGANANDPSNIYAYGDNAADHEDAKSRAVLAAGGIPRRVYVSGNMSRGGNFIAFDAAEARKNVIRNTWEVWIKRDGETVRRIGFDPGPKAARMAKARAAELNAQPIIEPNAPAPTVKQSLQVDPAPAVAKSAIVEPATPDAKPKAKELSRFIDAVERQAANLANMEKALKDQALNSGMLRPLDDGELALFKAGRFHELPFERYALAERVDLRIHNNTGPRYREYHRDLVESALDTGKLTPDQARELGHFETYPDLAAKYGKPAVEPKAKAKETPAAKGPGVKSFTAPDEEGHVVYSGIPLPEFKATLDAATKKIGEIFGGSPVGQLPYLFKRMDTSLEEWGLTKAGKELQDISTAAEHKSANDRTDLKKAIAGMNRADMRVVAKLMDKRNVEGATEAHRAKARELTAIMDRAKKEAGNVGIGTELTGFAFPQVPNKEGKAFLESVSRDIDVDVVNGRPVAKLKPSANPKIAAAVKNMLAKNPGMTESEALGALSEYANRYRTGKVGYLEGKRTVQLPDNMREWDLDKILPSMVDRSWRRVEAARQWGGNLEKAAAYADEIRKTQGKNGGAYAQIFNDYVDYNLKHKPEDGPLASFFRGVGSYETASKMSSPKTGLRNALQTLTNLAHYPIIDQLQSMAEMPPYVWRFMKSGRETMDELERSGAVSHMTELSFREGNGVNMVMKLVGQAPAEHKNQWRTAHIAKIAYMNDVKRLMRAKEGAGIRGVLDWINRGGEGASERRLQNVGVKDTNAAIAKMKRGEPLSDRESAAIMQRATEDSQFAMTLVNTPAIWSGRPGFRLLAKFKPWGLNQLKYINKYVLREAMHGNPRPMVKFAAGTIIANELVNIVANQFTDKDKGALAGLKSGRIKGIDDPKMAEELIKGAMFMGAFGVIGDLVYGGVPDYIGGPTGGTAKNIFDFAKEVMKRPSADQAGLAAVDFARNEFPIVRQVEDAAKTFSGDDKIVGEQGALARTEAFEKRDIEEYGALRHVKNLAGRKEYETGPGTLAFRSAAKAIDAGDIEDATETLVDLFSGETDRAKLAKTRQSAERSLMSRSPLGAMGKKDRAAYLRSLDPQRRAQVRREQLAYERAARQAIQRAGREAMRGQ